MGSPKEETIFKLREVELDERFEAVLVVTEVADGSPVSLAGAVAAWAEVLPTAHETVRGNDDYDNGWFGFGVLLDGEGLATHEEIETGCAAARWLTLQDAAYLPLYIEYLGSLDLDHTVEQPAVLQALLERHGRDQLAPLLAFVKKRGGQVLGDWLDGIS